MRSDLAIHAGTTITFSEMPSLTSSTETINQRCTLRPSSRPRTGSGSNHHASPRRGVDLRIIFRHPFVCVQAVHQRSVERLAVSPVGGVPLRIGLEPRVSSVELGELRPAVLLICQERQILRQGLPAASSRSFSCVSGRTRTNPLTPAGVVRAMPVTYLRVNAVVYRDGRLQYLQQQLQAVGRRKEVAP